MRIKKYSSLVKAITCVKLELERKIVIVVFSLFKNGTCYTVAVAGNVFIKILISFASICWMNRKCDIVF